MKRSKGLLFILLLALMTILLSSAAWADEPEAYEETEAELLTDAVSLSANELPADEMPADELPAEEPSANALTAADPTEAGGDADVSNPLAPKDGSAQIVEYVEEGSPNENLVDELIEDIQDAEPQATDTTVNDVPSVTHVVNRDVATEDVVDEYYTLTETGQIVEINEDAYPLPKDVTSTEERPFNNIQTTLEVYNSENAIQKAVDRALQNISEKSSSVTISVAPGEYDGGLTVQKSDGASGVNWDSFTLYIVADDAYTPAEKDGAVYDKSSIHADGAGEVHLNGDVKIDGVNVFLAGLFFSMQNPMIVNDANVTIKGTAQSDSVAVDASGTKNLVIDTGSGNDTISVCSSGGGGGGSGARMELSGGGGDDSIAVDISAADYTSDATVSGGSGRDTLELTGALKHDGAGSTVSKKSGASPVLILQNALGHTINIHSDTELYTDSLENKKSAKLGASDVRGGVITLPSEGSVFVDYVIDLDNPAFMNSGKVLPVSSANSDCFLAGLILNGEGKVFTLGNITAPGMNVRITGREVTLDKSAVVKVGNLTVLANDSDGLIEYEMLGDFNVGGFVDGAKIEFMEGSRVESEGSVILRACTDQTQVLIPFSKRLNPLVVKIGKSSVILRGQINAAGSIEATTKQTVTVDASNGLLAGAYVPASVNIALSDSIVEVKNGARLEAGGSVELSALTDIAVTAHGVTGQLSYILAVSVVSANTHVDVAGDIKAGGSVILTADSKINADTNAANRSDAKTTIAVDEDGNPIGDAAQTIPSQYGIYVAVAVVDADTYARIGGSANVEAGEDVLVTSNSTVINNSTARSADAKIAGAEAAGTETINNAADLFLTALDYVYGYFDMSEYDERLKKAENQVIATTGYKVDAESNAGGTISTVSRAKKDDCVDITVILEEGYTVGSITMKYLDSGKWIEVEVDTQPTEGGVYYAFLMPAANVTLSAVFVEADGDEDPIVNREGGEGQISAFDALNSANEEYFRTVEYGSAYKIEGSGSAEEHGFITPNTKTADGGQMIRFIIEPAEGYVLKEGTIVVSFHDDDGVWHHDTVSRSSTGIYAYELPDNIAPGETLTVKAQFRKADKKADAAKADQQIGAFAIGVTVNDNEAVIDTTGKIKAGGNLELLAFAGTQSAVYADGTPIKSTVEEKVEDSSVSSAKKPDNVTHAAAQTVDAVEYFNYKNHEYTVKIEATAAGLLKHAEDKTLTFIAKPDEGYEVKVIQLVLWDNKGKAHSFDLELLQGTEDTYVLNEDDRASVDFEAIQNFMRVTALFEGKEHKLAASGLLPQGVKLPEKAHTGDIVTISTSGADKSKTYSLTVLDAAGEEIPVLVTREGTRLIFTMPDADIRLKLTEGIKQIDVQVDEAASSYVAVFNKAEKGERVELTLTDKLLDSDKSYTVKVKVGDREIKLDSDNSFLVPSDLADGDTITISVVFGATKAIGVKINAAENGTLRAPARVNGGEKIEIRVTPAAGYKLADGILVSFIGTDNSESGKRITADAAGKYFVEIPLENVQSIELSAAFEQTQGKQKPEKTFGFGAAVSVNVFTSKNNAVIKRGTIEANGLKITANSGTEGVRIASSTISEAGYAQGDFGIAGAVAVAVNNIKTNAAVEPGAVLTLGNGPLDVSSAAYVMVTEKAEAFEPTGGMVSAKSSTGVGAGIAVNVTNVSTTAIIKDGVDIRQAQGSKLSESTITADTTLTETIAAKAGAEGGRSATPALVVAASGVRSLAELGSGSALSVAGDVKISSSTGVFRKMLSSADTRGDSCCVGAAMLISVLNDSAQSHLKRGVQCRDLTVKASSRAMNMSNLTASGKGNERSAKDKPASSGDKKDADADADSDADGHCCLLSMLSSSNGEGNMNSSVIASLLSGRQKAQTTEGSLGIAAAFALNIENNKAEAVIADGLVLVCTGDVIVNSRIRTDVYLTANASVVNSSTGVGAAAALNIVNYTNRAYVGASKISAKSLDITAVTGDSAYSADVKKISKKEMDNVLSQYVQTTFEKLFASILKTAGVSQSVIDSLTETLGTIAGHMTEAFLDKLLQGTGLEGLLAADIAAKIDQCLADMGETLEESTKKYLSDFIINAILGSISRSFKNPDGKPVGVTYKPDTKEYLSEGLRYVGVGIANDLLNHIVDVNKFANFIKNCNADEIKTRLWEALKKAGVVLTTKLTDALLGALGVEAEVEDPANRSVISTQAISGAGATNVGVAGVIAIAIVNGNSEAVLADAARSSLSDTSVKVDEVLRLFASDNVRLITAASAAADAYGNADVNPSARAESDDQSNADVKDEKKPETALSADNAETSVGVGAGFALSVLNNEVSAKIGKNRSITAGAIGVDAQEKHKVTTASAAGTDPFKNKSLDGVDLSDYGLDAAVTVQVVNITVDAGIDSGCVIVTTGGNDYVISEFTDAEGNTETVEGANLYIHASETGYTEAIASSMADGNDASVGATVAVNVVNTDVTASFGGSATLPSNVDARIVSEGSNEDMAYAKATAMGADLSRYFKKFGTATGKIGSIITDIEKGNYDSFRKEAAGQEQKNAKNKTSYRVIGYLTGHKSEDGSDASAGLPLSENVLGLLGAKSDQASENALAEGLEEAFEAAEAANDASNTSPTKYEVAASVGVNITDHNIKTRIIGSITAGDILAEAINNADFRNRASSAAASLSRSSNAVSAGVAVTVTDNDALVEIDGKLDAKKAPDAKVSGHAVDNIRILASLTQNTDKGYIGSLASQAISGSVSSGAKATVAVALAIVTSDAKSAVYIADGSHITAVGTVGVEALDCSKLAARAGSISASKGSSVGMGASFALVYNNNVVETVLGTKNAKGELIASGIVVSGSEVTIAAIRKAVSDKDFRVDLGLDYLVTKSAQEESNRGIVDFHQDTITRKYTVTVNINTDTLINLVDLLNFLTCNNSYAEAIGGYVSAAGGDSKAAAAGSVAMIFNRSAARVLLGQGITITSDGLVDVKAEDRSTARIIAGAANVAPSKVGVGFTLTCLDNQGTVEVIVGDGAVITAGAYTQNALNETDFLVIAIAASVDTSASASFSGGAVIDVVNMQNKVRSTVGKNVTIKALNGDILIDAYNDNYLVLIAAATPGINGKIAAGGTINVVVSNMETKAATGDNTKLTASGNIAVTAYTSDRLADVLAAVSPAFKADKSVAGTVGVTVVRGDTDARIGKNNTLSAGKDILVSAQSEAWLMTLDTAVAVGSRDAVGASVLVHVLKRTADAVVDKGSTLTATHGSVNITAPAKDWELFVTLTAGAAGTNGMEGSIPVTVNNSVINASLLDNCTVTAGDSVGVTAGLDSKVYMAAGGFTLALAGNAIGGTVATSVLNNTVSAYIGNGVTVKALCVPSEGGGVKLPNKKDKRSGIVLYAGGSDDVVIVGAAGGGGASKIGASAVINTLVISNTFTAKSEATSSLTAEASENGDDSSNDGESHPRGSVYAEACEDSDIVDISDGISVGGNSVGAVVSTLVVNKTLKAVLAGTVKADGDIVVRAHAEDDITFMSMSLAGGSYGIAGDINTVVVNSTVIAALDADVTKAADISVTAVSDEDLITIGIGAGAGTTSGGSAVVIIPIFNGTTRAYIDDDHTLSNISGCVTVLANSSEDITADVFGAFGSSTMAAAGAVEVAVAKQTTEAYIGNRVTLTAQGYVSVIAKNEIELFAIVAQAAGSGSVAVGAAVTVLVDLTTTTAQIGNSGSNNCGTGVTAGNVSVQATSERDVVSVTGTLGAAGTTGVGASVAVIVAGSKMSQSAHDMIYSRSIIPEDCLDKSLRSSKYLQNLGIQNDLALLLEGDNQHPERTAYSDFGRNANYPESAADGKESVEGYERADTLPSDTDFNTDITISSASFGKEYKNTVSASIASGAIINAVDKSKGNISVIASDLMSADIVTGAIGAGGTAGIGVGLSVVVTASEVNAVVRDGAQLSAEGNIEIRALSGVSDKDISEGRRIAEDRLDKDAVIDAIKESDSSITISDEDNRLRLIGFAGAGAYVGVGVNGALLFAYNQVNALLSGDVTKADNIYVETQLDYGEVLAVSAGVSGGYVGVDVSASVVYFSGKVETAIAGDAKIQNVTGVISVVSTGDNRIQSASGNLAAGGVGANASLALGINKNKVYTFIGQGVSIENCKDITLNTKYGTDTRVYNINAALGAIAAGVAVDIAINELKAYTFIGSASYAPQEAFSAAAGNIHVSGMVSVLSDIAGDVYVLGVPAEGGAVGGNAIVALGFNDMTGHADIANINITAKNLVIRAVLCGDVDVTVVGVSVNAIGGGIDIAVGKNRSENQAMLDLSNHHVDITGSFKVYAGESSDRPSSSDVTVKLYAANGALINGAFNFAVALNKAVNNAFIKGTNTSASLHTSSDGEVRAFGEAYAYSYVIAGGLGLVEVRPTLAYAKLNSTQNAAIDTLAAITIGGKLYVTSEQNKQVSGGKWEITAYHPEKNAVTKSGTKQSTAEAVLYNASATGANVTTGIAIALADATGKAYIHAGSLDVTGDILTAGLGNSSAKARTESLSVDIVAVGVTVAHAYADGDFAATITTTGKISSGGTIRVENRYNASSVSELSPALGGVSVEGAAVKVNVAYAGVETDANAGLKSTSGGEISATGDIHVLNVGSAYADARIKSVKFNLSLANVTTNTAVAKLDPTAAAFIDGAVVNAKNVSVSSFFNVKDEEYKAAPTAKEKTGAYAETALPLANITVAQVKVNVAYAKSDAVVSSYVKTGAADIAGNLDVITCAASYAKATVGKSAGDVSAISIPVIVVDSNADGTYKAYIEANGSAKETIKAGDTRILASHCTVSEAEVLPVGGKGTAVDITGATIAVNRGTAYTEAEISAYLTGKGNISLNSLNVKADGTAKADVRDIDDTSVSLSLLNVKGVEVVADLNLTQSAFFAFDGTADIAHDLNVISTLNGTAKTIAGNTKGVRLTLVDGSGCGAYTNSEAHNSSYLKGSGTVTVHGNATVKALGGTYSSSEVKKSVSADIAQIQAVLAKTTVMDNFEAYVSGLTLNADGSFTLYSEIVSEAYADSVAQLSLSVLDGNGGTCQIYVGDSGKKRQSSMAYLADKAVVTAKGNISVKAANTVTVKSTMRSGWDVSVVVVQANTVPTSVYMKTSAGVGDGCKLISTAGTVTLETAEKVTATAIVDGDCVGIIVSADCKYGHNTVDQLNSIFIGKNAVVSGSRGVFIATGSDAVMTAKTSADFGGLFSGGTLQARNTLNRKVSIDIGDGATISSELGTISIQAFAGDNDDIYARASGKSAGFLSIDNDMEVTNTYNSGTEINIGGNVTITASAEDVLICAWTSAGRVRGEVSVPSGGVVAIAEGTGDFRTGSKDNYSLYARVIIAKDKDTTTITGRDITVAARLHKLYLYQDIEVYAKGLGGDAESYARAFFGIDLDTYIGNVTLHAFRNVHIYASGTPDVSGENIHLRAYAEVAGLGGDVDSYAQFKSNGKGAYINATVSGKAVIYAGTARIEAFTLSLTKYLSAYTKLKAIGDADDHYTDDFKNVKATTYIEDGAAFRLGDSAGGRRLVFTEENGKVVLEASGKGSVKYTVDEAAKTITIPEVTNSSQGALYISNNQNPNGLKYCKVGGVANVSYLDIVNKTSYDLIFSEIALGSRLIGKTAVVFTDCVCTDYTITDETELGKGCQIIISSEQPTDVTFNGLVNNELGDITIRWTGEKGGNLYSKTGGIFLGNSGINAAPVWAHSFTVSGAANIGTEQNLFWVYLNEKEDKEAPTINISADGNIYLRTSLSKIVSYLGDVPTPDGSEVLGDLSINNATAGKILDIRLDNSVRINYLATIKTFSIIMPGTISLTNELFFDDAKTTTTDLDGLFYYRTSDLSNESYDAYQLPNGMQLYVSKTDGRVKRIISTQGRIFDVDQYRIEGDVIYFASLGYYFNYKEGTLYFDDRTYYGLLSIEVEQTGDGQYKALNMDGTITSEQVFEAFDSKFERIDTDKLESFEIQNMPNISFKLICQTEEDDKPVQYLLGTDPKANVTHMYRRVLGDEPVLMFLNPQILTINYSDINPDTDDKDLQIKLYAYTNDPKNPLFYVVESTAYYYTDARTPDYRFRVTGSLEAAVDGDYTSVQKYVVDTSSGLDIPTVYTGLDRYSTLVFDNIPLKLGEASETNKVVLSFINPVMDSDGRAYYEIADGIKVSTDGYIVDSSYDNVFSSYNDVDSYEVRYDAANGNVTVTEKTAAHSFGVEYVYNNGDPTVTVKGMQRLRFLNGSVAADMEGNFYRLNADNTWEAVEPVRESDFDVIRSKDNKILIAFGTDQQGDAITAEVFYDLDGNEAEAVTVSRDSEVRWYEKKNGQWNPVPQKTDFKSAAITAGGYQLVHLEGGDVRLTLNDAKNGLKGSDLSDANIRATGKNGCAGNIVITTMAAKYLGTEDAPLAVDMAGELKFGTVGVQDEFNAPIWITSDGNLKITEVSTDQTIHIGGQGNIRIDNPKTPTGELVPLNVDFFRGSGAVSLYNEGDIHVTISSAEYMTADRIVSSKGTVTIDAGDGGMTGMAHEGAFAANVFGAKGVILKGHMVGTADKPLYIDSFEGKLLADMDADYVYIVVDTDHLGTPVTDGVEDHSGFFDVTVGKVFSVRSLADHFEVYLKSDATKQNQIIVENDGIVSGALYVYDAFDLGSVLHEESKLTIHAESVGTEADPFIIHMGNTEGITNESMLVLGLECESAYIRDITDYTAMDADRVWNTRVETDTLDSLVLWYDHPAAECSRTLAVNTASDRPTGHVTHIRSNDSEPFFVNYVNAKPYSYTYIGGEDTVTVHGTSSMRGVTVDDAVVRDVRLVNACGTSNAPVMLDIGHAVFTYQGDKNSSYIKSVGDTLYIDSINAKYRLELEAKNILAAEGREGRISTGLGSEIVASVIGSKETPIKLIGDLSASSIDPNNGDVEIHLFCESGEDTSSKPIEIKNTTGSFAGDIYNDTENSMNISVNSNHLGTTDEEFFLDQSYVHPAVNIYHTGSPDIVNYNIRAGGMTTIHSHAVGEIYGRLSIDEITGLNNPMFTADGQLGSLTNFFEIRANGGKGVDITADSLYIDVEDSNGIPKLGHITATEGDAAIKVSGGKLELSKDIENAISAAGKILFALDGAGEKELTGSVDGAAEIYIIGENTDVTVDLKCTSGSELTVHTMGHVLGTILADSLNIRVPEGIIGSEASPLLIRSSQTGVNRRVDAEARAINMSLSTGTYYGDDKRDFIFGTINATDGDVLLESLDGGFAPYDESSVISGRNVTLRPTRYLYKIGDKEHPVRVLTDEDGKLTLGCGTAENHGGFNNAFIDLYGGSVVEIEENCQFEPKSSDPTRGYIRFADGQSRAELIVNDRAEFELDIIGVKVLDIRGAGKVNSSLSGSDSYIINIDTNDSRTVDLQADGAVNIVAEGTNPLLGSLKTDAQNGRVVIYSDNGLGRNASSPYAIDTSLPVDIQSGGDVHIESENGSLVIGRIDAEGKSVTIRGNQSVTDVIPENENSLITASSVIIRTVRNIGSSDTKPLNVYADALSATARDNVWVQNLKPVEERQNKNNKFYPTNRSGKKPDGRGKKTYGDLSRRLDGVPISRSSLKTLLTYENKTPLLDSGELPTIAALVSYLWLLCDEAERIEAVKRGKIIKVIATVLSAAALVQYSTDGIVAARVIERTGDAPKAETESAAVQSVGLPRSGPMTQKSELQRTLEALSDVGNERVELSRETLEAALGDLQRNRMNYSEDSEEYRECLDYIGYIQLLLDDIDASKASFLEAITLDNTNEFAYLILGEISLYELDPDSAVNYLDRYIELDPVDVSRQETAAKLFYSHGYYDLAVEYGEAAEQAGGGLNFELQSCLGLSWLMLDDFTKAKEHLSQSIDYGEFDRLNADDPTKEQVYAIGSLAENYYYRGLCYLTEEDYENAARDYTEALNDGYDDSLIFFDRGVCYVELGCMEDAKADFEMIVERGDDPDFVDIAKELIEEIEIKGTVDISY